MCGPISDESNSVGKSLLDLGAPDSSEIPAIREYQASRGYKNPTTAVERSEPARSRASRVPVLA